MCIHDYMPVCMCVVWCPTHVYVCICVYMYV